MHDLPVCGVIAIAVVLITLSRVQAEPASKSASGAANANVSPPVAAEQAPAEAAPAETTRGAKLYAQHCSACHGKLGDGKGIAANFLFPKPRDLLAGNFRLVSTDNNVPTREDLHAVLLRGMPGSAMPPWAHLPQADREALVDEVLRLRDVGARDSYVKSLKETEGLTDEELAAEDVQAEIKQHVTDFTTPGGSTEAPTMAAPTPESISRGKEIYTKFACKSCHGETGKGDGAQSMVDIEQLPTRPRDFTLGIFKGNPDPASLYRRIAYGMPGTPMPGSSTMTADERVDLVNYVLSLSTEQQRKAAVLNRERLAVRRVRRVGGLESDQVWAAAPVITLRMAPIWWRNDSDFELRVQAVHDGREMAVRLSWADPAEEKQPLRSESFKDAAAMELYRGAAEPFLGMGAMDAPIDIWFWDADRQVPAQGVEDVNPRMVVDVYPFSEKTVDSPDINRPGARSADQPNVSLPARAVGNQITPPGSGSGGSSLQAGGPGASTFRLPKSQLVHARGAWADGRWTVVMTRSLALGTADDGIALEPGSRASAAFAVWDGGHRDRDGQKLITIWQDLQLDK
jgi:mono/diheme cytochrome c family protein